MSFWDWIVVVILIRIFVKGIPYFIAGFKEGRDS